MRRGTPEGRCWIPAGRESWVCRPCPYPPPQSPTQGAELCHREPPPVHPADRRHGGQPAVRPQHGQGSRLQTLDGQDVVSGLRALECLRIVALGSPQLDRHLRIGWLHVAADGRTVVRVDHDDFELGAQPYGVAAVPFTVELAQIGVRAGRSLVGGRRPRQVDRPSRSRSGARRRSANGPTD